MSERLIVFDLEILNHDPSSICAIGIVELVDLEIHSTYYSLIKPQNLEFDPYSYKIHKIRPRSLINERTFPEVWKEVKHYFDNTIVMSHDIQGDMLHLRKVLKQYKLSFPSVYMSCTNVLAHLVYPQLQKYNLKDLCLMNGYQFEAHHALEDAKATSFLYKKILEEKGCQTLKELHEFFHLEFGEMKSNYYRNMVSPEVAPQLLDMVQKEDALLYHRSICFTGKLAMPKSFLEEKTKEVSALSSHQVNQQTDYLVIGDKGYLKARFGKNNKKVLRALQLKKQGQDIHIVKENEFIKMLGKKR